MYKHDYSDESLISLRSCHIFAMMTALLTCTLIEEYIDNVISREDDKDYRGLQNIWHQN